MKAKEINAVQVFRRNELIGTLKRTKDGCVFSYDENANLRLGVAMPLYQTEWRQSGDNLIPFFANLLPEGRRLGLIAKREKVSSDDMFSLLLLLGDELIGDVHVEPTVKSQELPKLERENLLFKDIRNRVQDFAGVQDKLSVHKEYRFVQNAGDYGILKFGDDRFPRLVQNEFFFMNLARKAKFKVPKVQVVTDSSGEEALYILRFDRVKLPKKNGWKMLHQEDGCQACLAFPSRKYSMQFHGLIGEMCGYCASSQLAKFEALRMYAFAYLIGNGDLHAKNISLLENDKTSLMELAPVYDMVSTLPYDLDQKMALPFYGKDNAFSLKTFVQYAGRLGLPESKAKTEIEHLAAVVSQNLNELEQISLPDDRQKKLITEISQRLHKFG